MNASRKRYNIMTKNQRDQLQESNTKSEKVELEFPLTYAFKVFVDPRTVKEESLYQLVISLLNRPGCVKSSATKSSKTGKYLSYTLNVALENRTEMENLYNAFKQLHGVKYLL